MVVSSVEFSLAYVVCGALPLSLVPYVRRHGPKPGSFGLLITIFGLACWAFSTGVLDLVANPAAELIAASAILLGGHLAGIGYFLIAAECGGWFEPSRPALALLAMPVIAFQGVALTDPVHQLVWGGHGPGSGADGLVGPLFVVYLLFGFGFALVGLAMLASQALAGGVQRRQSIVLVFAGTPPVVLAAAGIFVFRGVHQPIAPFGFTISAVLYAGALFRTDFLDIVPVSHRRIVEQMDDATITLDADGRVVDANATARRLSGYLAESDSVSGAVPLDEFFPELPGALERFEDRDGIDAEITLSTVGADRHFHLNTSRIEISNGRSAGRLIVLRDISDLKRRERMLEEREQQLDLLRQVLARVLRHNIRNDLTVVRGYAHEIKDRGDETDARFAGAIVEKCDGLVELSNKAATIERLVTGTETGQRIDLPDVLGAIVERYRRGYPSVDFRFDAPASCVIETAVPVEFALENLIENAAEHNDGSDATVTVSITCDDGRATITVDDDGPGIPAHELEVLQRGEETPLEHGSGLGLWIVYWIVEHSACSVSFATGEEGTTIAFSLPMATDGPSDGERIRA